MFKKTRRVFGIVRWRSVGGRFIDRDFESPEACFVDLTEVHRIPRRTEKYG